MQSPSRGRHTEPPRPRYNTVPNDGVHLCRCPRRSACAGRAPPRLPRRTRAHPRRCLRAGCPRGDPFHGRLPLRLRLRQGHRAQAERGPLRLLREFPRTSRDIQRACGPNIPLITSPTRGPTDDVWWTVARDREISALTRASAPLPGPQQTNPNAKDGSPYAIYGVYDGHGGFAVSQWLTDNLANFICEEWPKADFCLEALSQACLRADYDLIQPPPGFFGAFGERGVGGAKCGSTAVTALLFEQGGKPCLATANVGDARILLVRDGKAVQLSVDHVPDDEAERKRIDRGNPNLRKSLVTFTEGSWRVGGVLALSRAFGDAFLKESGRFEGLGERNADYGSGFGLNAEPDCAIEQLSDLDSWVMLSSDGLFANDERGGGGGFENQEIADFLLAAPADASPESLAKELCSMAVSKGSTDDVTVTLMRL